MTIGIYKLQWDEVVYIGQSVNVEKRIKTHMNNLVKSKHSNKAMQSMYDTWGPPNFAGLICEVNEHELNSAEVHFIEEFNSYHAGLNGNTGGGTRTGGELDRSWTPEYSVSYRAPECTKPIKSRDPLGYLANHSWPEGWKRRHIAASCSGKPIPPIDVAWPTWVVSTLVTIALFIIFAILA